MRRISRLIGNGAIYSVPLIEMEGYKLNILTSKNI